MTATERQLNSERAEMLARCRANNHRLNQLYPRHDGRAYAEKYLPETGELVKAHLAWMPDGSEHFTCYVHPPHLWVQDIEEAVNHRPHCERCGRTIGLGVLCWWQGGHRLTCLGCLPPPPTCPPPSSAR